MTHRPDARPTTATRRRLDTRPMAAKTRAVRDSVEAAGVPAVHGVGSDAGGLTPSTF